MFMMTDLQSNAIMNIVNDIEYNVLIHLCVSDYETKVSVWFINFGFGL